MLPNSTRLLTVLVPWLFGAVLVIAAEPGGSKTPDAKTQFQELRAQLEKGTKQDRERLRHELMKLQHSSPGTPAALEAARLVTQLPSPLDLLDAAKIPKKDRAPWLPKEVVAVLGSQQGRSWSYGVSEMAASRNGKFLVTADFATLRVWNAETLDEMSFVHANADAVRGLVLSRDDKTLIAMLEKHADDGYDSENIWQVWNVSSEGLKLRTTFRAPMPRQRRLTSLSELQPTFLPDNKTVLTTNGGDIDLWDISIDPPVKRTIFGYQDIDPKTMYDASDDGSTFVILGEKRASRTNDSSKAGQKQYGQKPANDVAMEAYLMFWDLRQCLPAWDLRKRMTPKKVKIPDSGHVFRLALSPDGTTIALLRSTKDKRIVLDLYDRHAARLRLKARIPITRADFKRVPVILNRGDRLVVMEDWDNNKSMHVCHWVLSRTGPKKVTAFTIHDCPPVLPAFTNGKQNMIVPGTKGALHCWDLTSGKRLPAAPIVGHSDWVSCVRFMPDGSRLLSGGHDKSIRLWEPTLGRFAEKAVFRHGGVVFDLAVAPRKGLLASTGFSPAMLQLWDLNALPPKKSDNSIFQDTAAWVSVFSPDETTLYTCTGREMTGSQFDGNKKSDDAIHVWGVRGGKLKSKSVLRGHRNAIFGLAISPNGKLLAAGGGRSIYDKNRSDLPDLRLWNVSGANLKKAALLKGHSNLVYSVAFSPDGRILASAGRDQTVRLWRVDGSEPKELAVLRRHTNAVSSVSFGPDGTTLASCDFGGRIVVWNLLAKSVLHEFRLPGRVARVAFAPDGRHLASANANGTVYVFRFAPLRNKKESAAQPPTDKDDKSKLANKNQPKTKQTRIDPSQTVELRWRFKKGQELKYRYTQQRLIFSKIIGSKDVQQKLLRTFDTTLTIDKIHEDGSASVTVKIDRVRFQKSFLGRDEEFDSNHPEKATGTAERFLRSMQPLIRVKFSASVTSGGKAKSVKLSQASRKHLADAEDASLAAFETEETLKLFLPVRNLPVKKIGAGQSWEDEMIQSVLLAGKTKITDTHTLKSINTQTNQRIAIVSTRGKLSSLGEKGGPFGYRLKNSTRQGSSKFDVTNGRLLERHEKITALASLSLQGRELGSRFEMVDTCRLIAQKE